jgi:hypothetical protein
MSPGPGPGAGCPVLAEFTLEADFLRLEELIHRLPTATTDDDDDDDDDNNDCENRAKNDA